MARNAEGRKILKEVQAITNFKGDDQAEQVLEELRAYLSKRPAPERQERPGKDRKERGGHNRAE